jgi:dipeptidyl aminopeptidase/acylaminoacyl peptidase
VLRSLLTSTTTLLLDVDGTNRLLVRCDRTGTMQLYEHEGPGELHQLTALDEPVSTAAYVPGTRHAVLAVDRGGNERHQLFLLDVELACASGPRAHADLDAVTDDERFGHHLAGISPDGSLLAYLSNARNGVDFDLWICELATRQHRCVYDKGGWCQSSTGFSPDGRFVSIARPGPRPLDVDLLLVDVVSGDVRVVLAHPDEAALVEAPTWTGPSTLFVSENVGRDFAAIVRYDVATGGSSVVPGTGEGTDAQVVAARSGALLVIENDNGRSRLWLLDVDDPTRRTEVPLEEQGVVTTHVFGPPLFSRDGASVFYTLSSPRFVGDVWSYDVRTAVTSRVTRNESPIAAADLVVAEIDSVESFDGEVVPLFVLRPVTGGVPPVVVFIHGGPEAQALRSFNPVIQGLVAAGYAVVVPNVRGSTGYGRRYASLDDTTRRLDSVKDLAAVHGWLASAGLDPSRAALMGGSYGGYMVLAGLAFQPELWAAGVDVVGISDLVTFLEHTSDYRRAHREREYGSLATDREFLAEASPLRHADEMRAPLLVIHGRNDPRVPVSEAEQLTATLRARGVRCELVIYEDEGHGLARLENKLDAYPRAIEFLDEVLAVGAAARVQGE